MNPHLWIGFVGASLVMGLIPGPGVMSIVGYALGSGRRTALASVAGMAVGNLVAMSLSMAGVGALLAASAFAFAVLKWAGALCLIVLGGVAIARSRGPSSSAVPRNSARPRVAFASNFALGTFLPKTILFFVAFAPQFVSPAYSASSRSKASLSIRDCNALGAPSPVRFTAQSMLGAASLKTHKERGRKAD